MKKILYLVSRVPTGYSGREYILKQNIKFLRENEYDIHLAYLGGEDDASDLIKKGQVDYLIPLAKSNIFRTAFNVIFKLKYSLQERLFYSKKARLKLEDYIKNNGIELILVDMIRMSPFVKNIKNVKKCIEYDDLLSTRYERMLDIEHSKSNPLGTFSDKYPKLFSRMVQYFSRAVLSFESKKIAKREIELINDFNKISFTSSLEAELFSSKIVSLGKRKSFHSYSNPPCIYNKNETESVIKTRDFVFVGNLKSNHNLACLENIAKISSGLNSKSTNFKIDVFGDYDDRAVMICGKDSNITLHGRVLDLDKELASSKYLLSPFSFGTGIKIKIIESMYNKTLVITNSIGAEGIPMENDVHFKMCNSIEDFILLIQSLLNDDNGNTDLLVRNAFELVTNTYSKASVEKEFMNFIKC